MYNTGTGVTAYAAILLLSLAAMFLLVTAAGTLGNLSSAANAVTLEGLAVGQRVVTLPPLTEHAKKHPEAEEVRRLLSDMDTAFCRYICGNRTVYACRHPGDPKRWLFAVVEEGVATITAFFTNGDYALSKTRDNPLCRPFINAAHP